MSLFDRIRQAISDGQANAIVDVDGSYLYKKHKSLLEAGEEIAPHDPPLQPKFGWSAINEQNYTTMAKKIPPVTSGMVQWQLTLHF